MLEPDGNFAGAADDHGPDRPAGRSVTSEVIGRSQAGGSGPSLTGVEVFVGYALIMSLVAAVVLDRRDA